ncbi:biotin--[acetyl-CoA-carboxylase] ligase [Actinoplanes sp. TBRC 11911]|uniref:biotin--[acetyl-CoA-carboxylase] ligase n=1 Tax=Actinoplanes sp. TBRC 11911 TaxID=2729386 RepID=UPI00145CF8B7|nr:biotin--[acetyl-CoA-carboxylase] ligase [Actinoplanes sp. TBRC 11911]NMO50381.1 biotin--[acetyl-CoA-carboxylase] ligase [Actinoplanes sp. TBRC 11911]
MSSPFSDLDRPPLSARALDHALVTPDGFWTSIAVRAQTGSTNADAAAEARAGAPEGLVVVAEEQVAGRGRRDRQWVSPPRAGLAVSVLLRPGRANEERGWRAVPAGAYGWLPLLAGVALLEAVDRVAEVDDAALKWPNDLLVGGRKCAGILAEAVGDAVVIGLGVNVSTRAEELPETTGVPATSLRVAGAKTTDRDPLLRALLRGVASWYAGWRDADADAEMSGLLAAYRRRCSTIGRPVRVLLPGGGALEGEATEVDGQGQLVVRTADGLTHRVSAGDVLHVR